MNNAGHDSENTFIDLFAGCGGLSLGLMQAGWRGLFAVEQNEQAFKTLRRNLVDRRPEQPGRFDWPDWPEKSHHDIMSLLENRERLKRFAGNVRLICGGPPCQGFSTSGKRRKDDPRNKLVDAYVEFISIVQPELLLIENVPGIAVPHGLTKWRQANGASARHRLESYSDRLERKITEAGYSFGSCVINASDFGVPQLRTRYFGLGVRLDLIDVVNPAHTVGERATVTPDAAAILWDIRMRHLCGLGLSPRPIPAKQAIHDLRVLFKSSGKPRLLRPCKDTESRSGFFELDYKAPSTQNPYLLVMRAGLNGQPPNSLRLPLHSKAVRDRMERILEQCVRGQNLNQSDRNRLGLRKNRIVPMDGNRPSRTVTTMPDDIIHYSEPRILTVRECARLQSFPDWFEFRGPFTTGGHRRKYTCPRYTQVGNAVPPLLARAWGLALIEYRKTLRFRKSSRRDV